MIQPMHWLKQVEDSLRIATQIPLFGTPPNFPWQEVREAIATRLELQQFNIDQNQSFFAEPFQYLEGMGKDPFILCFRLTPLSGDLFFVCPQDHLSDITKTMLQAEKPISNPELQKGFLDFLFLQISDCIQNNLPYHNLHIMWQEYSALPKTTSFCFDFIVSLNSITLPCRLLISQEFQTAFISHFQTKQSNIFESEQTKNLSVDLSLQIGKTSLSLNLWKDIRCGDFLILDLCSYDLNSGKGHLTLTLGSTPLFRAKIKKTGLKIIDYYSTKEGTLMDDSIDHDFLDDEEEQSLESPQTPSLISPERVDLPLIVEIDKIQMSLEKLLQLQPGNILELSVSPSNGVFLTLHGKKIAKGELLQIGEVLGVRILELG